MGGYVQCWMTYCALQWMGWVKTVHGRGVTDGGRNTRRKLQTASGIHAAKLYTVQGRIRKEWFRL